MKLGLLLIALGMGYRVYADAAKEKGQLRTIGQWVGAFMMAVSLAVSVFHLYCYSGKITGKGYCPWKAMEEHHFTVGVTPNMVDKK